MIDFKEKLAVKRSRDFWHTPVYRYNLDSKTIDGKRYYFIPTKYNSAHAEEVVYPSVTTIISEKLDKKWLEAWIEFVGKDEAEKIKACAASHGTTIHRMAENFLLHKNWWEGEVSLNITKFNKLIPLLEDHVDHIYGQELQLWSHWLKTAGTTDLVCKWVGENAIVDFKTSRKHKTKEQITGYFIQAAAYALMVYERYRIPIQKIVIIMLVEHEDEPQVFIENVGDWTQKVEEIFVNG